MLLNPLGPDRDPRRLAANVAANASKCPVSAFGMLADLAAELFTGADKKGSDIEADAIPGVPVPFNPDVAAEPSMFNCSNGPPRCGELLREVAEKGGTGGPGGFEPDDVGGRVMLKPGNPNEFDATC